MSKVKILPEHIINKIAAGEVIERPASVIKELLENSIDAGATQIHIHLKDAGKTLIEIKDNGDGIESDDLENIFYRHATSKITDLDDLYAINSLGFRGEALYSIGAIADITVNARTKEQATGFMIHYRGGKKIDLKPSSKASHGTEISIKELFFNTPARKKFLKTNTTELHQILNIVIPYCLLHPSIEFLLTHQGKTLLDLKATTDQHVRITDTLHLNPEHILQCDHEVKEKNIALSLFLGDMNIRRARRDMQFIFVNGRPVAHKAISFALNQVYRLILPSEQVPFFAVFLDIPAEDIDANIHPTKKEVKISNENHLCRLLRNMVEQTLMNQAPTQQIHDHSAPYNTPENKIVTQALHVTEEKHFESSVKPTDFLHKPVGQPTSRSNAINAYPREQSTPPSQDFFFPKDSFVNTQEKSLRNKLEHAQFIGRFKNKYLLFESKESLLLMDQHAAGERITYESLIRQMNKGHVEVQRLLAPILVTASAQELLIWEDGQSRLHELGFETTLLDPTTIAVHSHPILITKIEHSVRQLLAGEKISSCDPDTIARRACRASVMSGDHLDRAEITAELNQLLTCLDPFTCPHGRPIVVEMTMDFLDKQFLRK